MTDGQAVMHYSRHSVQQRRWPTWLRPRTRRTM